MVKEALKYYFKGDNFLDLINEGNKGLIEALKKFDLTRENRFFTYALWWVRSEIRRYLSKNQNLISLPDIFYNDYLNFKKAYFKLSKKLKRHPSEKELAETLQIPEKKVKVMLAVPDEIISLDKGISDDNSSNLTSFLPDDSVDRPPGHPDRQFASSDLVREDIEQAHRQGGRDHPPALRLPGRRPHEAARDRQADEDEPGGHPPHRDEGPGQAEEPAAQAGHLWSTELNGNKLQDLPGQRLGAGQGRRPRDRPALPVPPATTSRRSRPTTPTSRCAFVGTELKSYFPDKDNPSQAKAKKAAEKFIADYPAVSSGLLFQGPTGVGKTRLLCCIGNQLIKEKGMRSDLHRLERPDPGNAIGRRHRQPRLRHHSAS